MISRTTTRSWLGATLLYLPWLAAHAASTSCVVARHDDNGGEMSIHTPTPILLAAATLPGTLPGTPGVAGAISAAGKVMGPIDWSSQHISAGATGETLLSGDVTVQLGTRELKADEATIDADKKTVRASGHVRYSDPLVRLQGDAGVYSESGSQFDHAQFTFLKQPGRGSARSIEVAPAGKLVLREVTYTTCPAGQTDWQIRARAISLDTVAERGVGHGARVEFKRVPLIYLPYISFPLSDSRQTGLLFPSIGSSSRSGAILTVPWYWNIAPASDLTLSPTVFSRRGVDLGAEYRFLSASNSGQIDANYLAHDNVFGDQRSHVQLEDRLQMAGNWRLDLAAREVSDTQYFEDFGQSTQTTSTAFLARQLTLGHRDDIWRVQAEVLNFQTLDTSLTGAQRPYTQLPRITTSALWHFPALPGLQAGFDTEVVDFTRTDSVTGLRLDARPQLSFDWTRPGYFVRPSVGWEVTRYSLQNAASADSSPQRSLPILLLDSGLQFERLAGSRGGQSFTLEPRLMYSYIPYRNQGQLPIFDTAPPDLNVIELFNPNRYVGIDRIGDTNGVTLGLTTHMFDSASGVRYLSATVGQTIYFQQPRVTVPTEVAQDRATSSLIAEIDLTAYRNWNLQLDVASSPDAGQVEKADVNLQYRPSGAQVVNLGYRFLRGELEQTDASVAWPIGAHWDAYARAVYSLQDRSPIEDFVGVQYRGACWGLRAVVRRSVTTRTGQQDTGFYLQLELNGLSSVGTGADTFLKQSIRGYSSTPTSR